MYVSFDQLPPHARVWIYQANRRLSGPEIISVMPAIARFAEEWTSHGRALQASAEFLHQHFLVIGLDEGVADASGCSIDASVHFVAQLEQRLQVSLLDKSQLAFLHDGQVQLFQRSELKMAIANGTVTPGTFYFDNTLPTKSELDSKWPQPAGQTWLARYFTQQEKNQPLA